MSVLYSPFFIYFCVFVSVVWVVYVFIPHDWSFFEEKYRDRAADKKGVVKVFFLILCHWGTVLESLGFSLLRRYAKVLSKKLVAADWSAELQAYEFMAIHLLIPVCVIPVMVLAVLRIALFGALRSAGGVALIFFGAFFVGLFLPWMVLNDYVARRKKSISRELPFALDMITSAVQAGLDFSGAIKKYLQKFKKKTPLKDEFSIVLKQINLGNTRAQALESMAERVDLSELSTVVQAFIQADQLGTGIGESLQNLSDDMRVKRFQKAEKMALEAPVKMLFPLIAFIFPAVFIILIGPLIIQIFQEVGR